MTFTWIDALRAAAALSIALTVAGCGNDDNEPAAAAATPPPAAAAPVDTSVVPASAFGSASAMLAFLKSLLASESGEPLRIDGIPAPPVDDVAEPAPLG